MKMVKLPFLSDLGYRKAYETWINPDHVACLDEIDGGTVVRLSTGAMWDCPLPIAEVIERLTT